jgi:hypothetical protein
VTPAPAHGFQPPEFPLPVRLVLTGWRAARTVGVARIPLDEASLIAAARRASGLHHFVDNPFDPLRRLLASLERGPSIPSAGCCCARAWCAHW